MKRVIGGAILVATLGCTSAEPAAEGGDEWVGSITTEGNVTTVVNEAGSVWGGAATLVEEASIGIDAGADEYMLGDVSGVYATDELIFVVDYQVPAVRVYGLDGIHRRNLGREGQGPGEFTRPSMITVDAGDRVFVNDGSLDRINVFSIEGGSLGTWPAPDVYCCEVAMAPASNGNLWVPTLVRNETTGAFRRALRQLGPDGPIDAVRWPDEPEPPDIEVRVPVRGNPFEIAVPLSPRVTWNLTSAAGIVIGASDDYHFEIQRTDGGVLAVQRVFSPVAVGADEADWRRRHFVASIRADLGRFGADTWDWDGAEMPRSKPAFSQFIPAATGEIWVDREGASERDPDCIEDPDPADPETMRTPCWRGTDLLDAFDAQGRFLGAVEVPPGMWVSPGILHVRGDQVVGVVEDELGTIRVKRWRLVPPG